jgi:ADP-ribosyl-[dinitrogen reductase] hydrolase
MRGAGPTTRAAVQRFVTTGELHATDGSSIGAAMRAAAVRLGNPGHRGGASSRVDDSDVADDARRSRGDHQRRVVAEMAAWAIEQHPVDAVIAAGLREAEELAQQHALHPATLQPLRQATKGGWPPNTAEPTLDALATVASVLHVLREARGLATAMKRAVALGGDTDTTAAIVGGILGCQLEDVGSRIPWLSSVGMPDAGADRSNSGGFV